MTKQKAESVVNALEAFVKSVVDDKTSDSDDSNEGHGYLHVERTVAGCINRQRRTMIPVLSICSFSETLRRFGASSDGVCATCWKQVVRNIFVDSCVICVHSSHFDWPDKPWMYLEMSDTLRAMLYLSEMTRPNGLQTLCLITDANMLMCEKCFITFLEQIEDTCKETSYWPYVLQIRSKYAIRTPDYVPSSERPDTSFYPSILGPIEGGLDSNDISSSTEQTSSSDKLPL